MTFPNPGRDVGVYDASSSPSVLIAGCQSKTITINNEPIDITSDDDSGYRTLLGTAGVRSVDISLEGVTKDATLIAAASAASPTLLKSYEIVIDGVGTLAGSFYAVNVELGAPTGDATTFSMSLQSSGTFTWTAV